MTSFRLMGARRAGRRGRRRAVLVGTYRYELIRPDLATTTCCDCYNCCSL